MEIWVHTSLRRYKSSAVRNDTDEQRWNKELPLVELRPVVRIRMRPARAELGTQFFLIGGQYPPVVPGIGFLSDANEGCRLAAADVGPAFDHLGQAAAKVVAAVAQIERRVNVNHVARAQLGKFTGITSGLDLAEACLAGAGSIGGGEGTAGLTASG